MHPGWSVQILATDLSEEMLAKAQRGRYGQLEVNRGLPAQMLVSNFERVGHGVGGQAGDPPDGRVPRAQPGPAVRRCRSVDVVFLRNVLIYFDTETKKQVLKRVRSVLRPDGYLFLGGAETTLNVDEAYRARSVRPCHVLPATWRRGTAMSVSMDSGMTPGVEVVSPDDVCIIAQDVWASFLAVQHRADARWTMPLWPVVRRSSARCG